MAVDSPDSVGQRAPARLSVIAVLGTGFNRWLLGGADSTPILRDWWALLRFIAATEGLLPDAEMERRLGEGGDATFAWESIVIAANRQRRAKGSREPASTTEDSLLKRLGARLNEAGDALAHQVQPRATRFANALTANGAREAEVLSLNFDRLLEQGLNHVVPSTGAAAEEWNERNLEPESCFDGRLRVWHAHGVSTEPATMVLGVHRYARATAHVVDAFGRFKAWEDEACRGLGEKAQLVGKHAVRDLPAAERTWVGTAINSPLLFLGCGLGRLESDIWEFLHLRARNHASLSDDVRPRIYRLTCDEESLSEREHWRSLSDGIAITPLRLARTWADSWEMILDVISAQVGMRTDSAQVFR
jgi:hypothetical protein